MKECFKCKETKEYTEFYKAKSMNDGYVGKCKECTRTDVKKNYRKNIDHYKEYDKNRAMIPHRVEMRREYTKSEAGKLASANGHDRYREKYPEKHKAHYTVTNAMRAGGLSRQPCEECGDEELIEAHHDDYSKPLDVRWLCRKHHLEVHGKVAYKQQEDV